MAEALANLNASIATVLSTLPPSDKIQDAERMQLLSNLDKLRAALEPPMISMQKLCLSAHGLCAAKLASSMGVFDAFAAKNGEEMTLADIHERCKGDTQLLSRVLRVLSVNYVLQEVGKDKYKPLDLALAFAGDAPPKDCITHFYLHLQVFAKMNDYFEETGYRNPGDAYEGPFQYALQTNKHYFDWLESHPEQQKAFNSVMTLGRHFRGEEWFEFFPVEEKLRAQPDQPVFVDFGGGVGHDITELKKRFPALPGTMVLQDLPQAIEDVQETLPAGVEIMKYDMFTSQPIKGAKAYYMRTVLHDWPDKQALRALRHIRAAMDNESILLINENTLPETSASEYSTELDLSMMACFSSLERTEAQWKQLVESADLKITNVWKPNVQLIGSNILIEAALP